MAKQKNTTKKLSPSEKKDFTKILSYVLNYIASQDHARTLEIEEMQKELK